jgi:hypothetical protein
MNPSRAFLLIVDTVYKLDPAGVADWGQVLFLGSTPGIDAQVSDLPALAGIARQLAERIPVPSEGSGLIPDLYYRVGHALVLRYGAPARRVMPDRVFSDGTTAVGGYVYDDVEEESRRLAAMAQPELLAQLGGAA